MNLDDQFNVHYSFPMDCKTFDPEPHDTLAMCRWTSMGEDIRLSGRGKISPNLNEQRYKDTENQICRLRCGRDLW